MVIDTSALVAITLSEPSEPALRAAIDKAASRKLSSVSLLEAGIVLRARIGEESTLRLDRLVEEIACEIIPFDAPQAKAAIAAFGRFGKGMGHRAQLNTQINLGDCAVYALAALRGEPVLATGADFRATDLTVVPLKAARQ
jgi:ribonuclease VapC